MQTRCRSSRYSKMRLHSVDRLVLGTAQFGSAYGVANRSGRVPDDELGAILRRAAEAGIATIDTAPSYGDCEKRLGEIGVDGWRIVSKLPELPLPCSDPGSWVRSEVSAILERLALTSLHGLLIHRPEQLLGPEGARIFQALEDLQVQQVVAKIGVSVYGPEDLEALWPTYRFDLVQCPLSIVDRRFVASGCLERLGAEGIEVHTRSAFLQGLLLMRPDERPATFQKWQSVFDRLDAWVLEQSMTPVQACLAYPLSCPEVDHVVVGVDNSRHLEQILDSLGQSPLEFPAALASEDLDLVNPTRWPTP